jgi:hypothetical protein
MGRVSKLYVSEIDKKLAEYNKTHPRTASQQEEIDKYARIDQMRDTSVEQCEPEEDIWDF